MGGHVKEMEEEDRHRSCRRKQAWNLWEEDRFGISNRRTWMGGVGGVQAWEMKEEENTRELHQEDSHGS